MVKIGSSSLMSSDSRLEQRMVRQVSEQVATAWRNGNPTALVSSGSVAAGLPALGRQTIPTDIVELQVAAAVGQGELMSAYTKELNHYGLTVGQVLITKDVLANRHQYLNARRALDRMLNEGIVPVINENDTVVVEELKLGDNDRLAALVAHLIGARLLIILTDTTGLFSADPQLDEAELLEAVRHSDQILDEVAQGRTGPLGSGGPATKVIAARMAAWSGIPTVIAAASNSQAVALASAGERVGTWVASAPSPLPARKLWIAFGQPSEGEIKIDPGATLALTARGASLLPIGVTEVRGNFSRGSAVEVLNEGGDLVAKGITRYPSAEIRQTQGRRFAPGTVEEVIHRDDLVILT